MSELTNPAPPPGRARPTSVTVSSYLLYLVAALQVIGLVVALSALGPLQEIYEDAFAGTEGPGAAFATAAMVVAAVLGLIVAIGLVVLGILNNRGKNVSRIITWVLGGLFACCSGFGVLSSALGSALGGGSSGGAGMPDQAEIQRRIEQELPWYTPVSVVLGVISVIALLVALILLALPASNEFFRKPQAAWEPPVPGAGYPPVPGGPYPGYPATPGYPSGQGTPATSTPPSTSTPPAPPSNPAANPPSGPSEPPAPPSS
ncbi:hypothetical protein SAMN05444365_1011124 [Micromonospora pattaloongensis]|uniref:Uncharacterized protein n=1 Tax=Micromonospora pattaloongensis TaxID=405436 RepID=A0A1H3I4Q7_9ACTN|nr:hypothetical protein [Micromonospora pattaloongensis]SDY22696.1 hypothetical protein SAMN05444365_1011124 [Micromonospora pattaloongensis]